MKQYWLRFRAAILGVAATAALCWMAVENFGAQWRELAELLLGAVLSLGLLMLIAFVLAWILRQLR